MSLKHFPVYNYSENLNKILNHDAIEILSNVMIKC